MNKMRRETKKGLIMGIIVAASFSVISFCLSIPFEAEKEIWTPVSYKTERASEVFLSGTALVKPLEEYKERFADAKATIVLAGEKLYYITKEEGLTYAAIVNYTSYNFLRNLTQGKIVGQKVFLRYKPDTVSVIVFGVVVPIFILIIFILGGSIAAKQAGETS